MLKWYWKVTSLFLSFSMILYWKGLVERSFKLSEIQCENNEERTEPHNSYTFGSYSC